MEEQSYRSSRLPEFSGQSQTRSLADKVFFTNAPLLAVKPCMYKFRAWSSSTFCHASRIEMVCCLVPILKHMLIVPWFLLHVRSCLHVQGTSVAGLVEASVCLIPDSPSEGITSGGETIAHLAGLSHFPAVLGGSLHQCHGLSLVRFSLSLLLLVVLMTIVRWRRLVCSILLRMFQLEMISSHACVAVLLHMPVQQLL